MSFDLLTFGCPLCGVRIDDLQRHYEWHVETSDTPEALKRLMDVWPEAWKRLDAQ